MFIKFKPIYVLLISILTVTYLWVYFSISVTHYTNLPWWYELGNDGDAVYPVETTTLLNDGKLELFLHPGTTLLASEGIFFRIISKVNPHFDSMLKMSEVQNMNDVLKIIELSTVAGRMLVLPMLLFLIICWVIFLVTLTKNYIISAFFLITIFTSQVIFEHSSMLRPEVFNLAFLLLAISTYLNWSNDYSKGASYSKSSISFLVVGLMIGLSFLSKVQTIIPIALFLLTVFYDLMINKPASLNPFNKVSNHWFIYIIMLCNLLFLPWWAFKNPDVGHLDYAREPLMLVVLFFIFWIIVQISLFLFNRSNNQFLRNIGKNFTLVSMGINLIIFGVIVSLYLILLPVSVKTETYMYNLRQLICGLYMNLSSGDLLIPQEITYKKIFYLFNHLDRVKILNFGIKNLVFLTFLFSVVGLIKDRDNRKKYILILFCFISGLTTDFLGAFHHPQWHIYSYYWIYTAVYYSSGLALFVSVVWNKIKFVNKNQILVRNIFISIIFTFTVTTSLFNFEKIASNYNLASTQTFPVGYNNIYANFKFFNKIIDEALKKKNYKVKVVVTGTKE